MHSGRPKADPDDPFHNNLWGPFLREVDSKLTVPVTLHRVGGFVLSAIYGIPRSTADLDYIEVVPKQAAEDLDDIAGQKSSFAKKHRMFIHFAGVVDLPDRYEERLCDPRFGLEKLRLLVPEPYDLLLSKLTRNSPKDREDVKFLVKKLDLQFPVLEERFRAEMRPWIPNAERHELTLRLWKDCF